MTPGGILAIHCTIDPLRALTRSGANVPRRSRNWLSLGRKAMESHGKPEDPMDFHADNNWFMVIFMVILIDLDGWKAREISKLQVPCQPCAQDSDSSPAAEVYQAVPWLQTEGGSPSKRKQWGCPRKHTVDDTLW